MSEEPPSIDPKHLTDLRERHLGRLLLRAYRAFSLRALEKLRQRGYDDLALAHTVLLTNVDARGTHLSSLAARVGVTRQAVARLTRNLETRGYLQRSGDPQDRRATIVALTASGWHLLEAVVGAKMEIEREYGAALGVSRMRALREGLSSLLGHME